MKKQRSSRANGSAMQRAKWLRVARSAVISSTVAAPLVHAQDAAVQTPTPAPASQDVLQEVVVTANRRAQSLADVPYNISSIGGDELAKSGATSLSDFARLSAGLV